MLLPWQLGVSHTAMGSPGSRCSYRGAAQARYEAPDGAEQLGHSFGAHPLGIPDDPSDLG
jgi:hypothetical protein